MWNWLTNIFAIIIVVFTALQAYFSGLNGSINWFDLVVGVVVAVVSYLSGKTFNLPGSVKK